MRILNGKGLRKLFLVPLVIFAFAFVACEEDTRVSISDSMNPPTFRLTGNGNLILFIVVGPYTSLAELESNKPDVDVIWQISADTTKNISNLPDITYGTLPPGFLQSTPKSGVPPALEEGKFYSIGTPSIGANFRRLCFKVDKNTVIKVGCRER